MADANNQQEKDDEIEDPVKVGKKAVEAAKKIHENEKGKDEAEAASKKDAEQWRNEG